MKMTLQRPQTCSGLLYSLGTIIAGLLIIMVTVFTNPSACGLIEKSQNQNGGLIEKSQNQNGDQIEESQNQNATIGGNTEDPCVFPFVFRQKTYMHCIHAGLMDGRMWCATTSNYDLDKEWRLCTIQEAASIGGNPEDPCVFPFVFEQKTYTQCTTEGRTDGIPWCATTSNYGVDKKWRLCTFKDIDTIGGNPGEDPCVFPFVYEQKTYKRCTSEGRTDGKLWCATTSNYDLDKKSRLCKIEDAAARIGGNPEHPCVFPFVFEQQTYMHCILDGLMDGRMWCATTSNYDLDKEWRICTTQETIQSNVATLVDTQAIINQVIELKKTLCRPGWELFGYKCYLLTSHMMSWSAAKKSCEEKGSHLVVINDVMEQAFLTILTNGSFTWIGLTEESGAWKWVDGTEYNCIPKNWDEAQPDNFYYPGEGSEDCAHLGQNGRWNDQLCTREYQYVCEKFQQA